VKSLAVCLAADESVRSGAPVKSRTSQTLTTGTKPWLADNRECEEAFGPVEVLKGINSK